jgi:hypothetical protein
MKEWYYAIEGKPFGPYLENELSGLVRDGLLTPYTLVWSNELSDANRGWIQASDTELNILFPQTLQYKPIAQKPVNNYPNSPITEQDTLYQQPLQTPSSVPEPIRIDAPATIAETEEKTTDFFSKFKDSVDSTKKTSEKQLNTVSRLVNMGMIQSAILIILSIAIYFILRKYLLFQDSHSGFIAKNLAKAANYIIQKLILDPYATILFGMVFRSLRANVIPAIAYIIFMSCLIKYPKIEKLSPWIAYIALAVLILLLCLSPGPSLTTFMPWFWRFINISSMAVVFGLYFHSRKLGTGIAFCILCILNFLTYTSFSLLSTIVGIIPFVNILGGLAISGFRLIINVVEISQVFMLIAASNIIKFAIDSYIHKHFGITPIRVGITSTKD